jgi:hypothetical protein
MVIRRFGEFTAMKLVINRSQADKKGMMGGHKGVTFTLSTRITFSPEESELLEHYKLWQYPLFSRGPLPVTIRQIADGDVQIVDNVEILLANEEIVKRALDHVPPLLDVLRSFGGEEVVTYPRSGQD